MSKFWNKHRGKTFTELSVQCAVRQHRVTTRIRDVQITVFLSKSAAVSRLRLSSDRVQFHANKSSFFVSVEAAGATSQWKRRTCKGKFLVDYFLTWILGFFCYLAIASTKTWLSDIVCMSKSITSCCGSLFLLQNQCLNVLKAKNSLLKYCRYRHMSSWSCGGAFTREEKKKSIKWVMVSGQNLSNWSESGSYRVICINVSKRLRLSCWMASLWKEISPPNSCSDFYTQYEGSYSIHMYKRWIQLLGLINEHMHSF